MFFTQEDYRKIEEYLKQNSKKDTDFESLDAKDITSEDCVSIVHNLQNRKVNVFDLLSSDITGFFAKERELLDAKIKEFEELIKDFTIEKVGLTNEFGDSQIAAVSQKALTDAFHKVWSTLGEITGEVYEGISMIVTPEYYIGEDGCTVHVTASTINTNGVFEHIAFYLNDVLIAEYNNKDFIEFDTSVTDTAVIKCAAKIMGRTYIEQKLITHYSSFWLGAGNTYADIMNVDHVIPITNGMRGAYDINISQGQHIIVVVGETLADKFIRADINGIEIEFNKSTVTIGDTNYKVFTSVNTYQAGTINIDING